MNICRCANGVPRTVGGDSDSDICTVHDAYQCKTCNDNFTISTEIDDQILCDNDACMSKDLNDCDEPHRATCTDTVGSYKCECNHGFHGDGKNCFTGKFLGPLIQITRYVSKYYIILMPIFMPTYYF